HCGKRQDGVRQVDPLAVGQPAADLYPGPDRLRVTIKDGEPQLAVVQQQRVTGFDCLEDLAVRQVDAPVVAVYRVQQEVERLPLFEHGGTACDGADPELRPLQVDQDANRPATLGLDGADSAVKLL